MKVKFSGGPADGWAWDDVRAVPTDTLSVMERCWPTVTHNYTPRTVGGKPVLTALGYHVYDFRPVKESDIGH